MRTTISIDEHLLREAKEQAARADTSLSAFIGEALREALSRRNASTDPEPVRLLTVRGERLPGIDFDSYAELEDRAEGLG